MVDISAVVNLGFIYPVVRREGFGVFGLFMFPIFLMNHGELAMELRIEFPNHFS